LLALASAGCRQDMHDAPRYDPLEASSYLPKGSSAQPLVPGTVPRGHLDDNEALIEGKTGGKLIDAPPMTMTRADLDRGQERFDVYCSPCHGRTGEGNGMVVQRGYKQAANYHVERLRQMPIGYFYDVMTNGFGAMPDYRTQIPVDDRWRIAAYVRVLQVSHSATTADVPADQLRKLNESGAGGQAAPAPEPPHGGRGGQQ
jgi:mono/diheme cytochrome c family protein